MKALQQDTITHAHRFVIRGRVVGKTDRIAARVVERTAIRGEIEPPVAIRREFAA